MNLEALARHAADKSVSAGHFDRMVEDYLREQREVESRRKRYVRKKKAVSDVSVSNG